MSHITFESTTQTEAFGEQVGRQLQAGDILCLQGELGAGKTTFTRGLARGWGALEPVTSPTFTLVNTYTRQADSQQFFHLDCYRLTSPEEVLTLAFDDILTTVERAGVLVVEWPERIKPMLPEERLWLHFTNPADDDRRTLTMEADGPRFAALLSRVR